MIEVVSLVTALLFGFAVILLWKIVQVLIEYKHLLDVTKHIPKLKYHHPVWGDFAMMKDMGNYHKWLMEDVQRTGVKWHVLWVLFLYPVYIAEHPDTVKTILKSSTSKAKGIDGPYTVLEQWLGNGLITIMGGPKWERNRRLLTPAFHFDILQPYVTEYNQVADILLKRCFLGMDVCEYKGLVDKFLELCDYVHEFAMKIIGSRRQALAKDPDQVKKRRLDFLDILLIARDENGQGLTDEEIRQEVDTFMFAGHDTTSSAIYWGIYALGKYPAVQEKVYEEITAIMGEKASLDCPVPAIARQLDVPTVVEGVELPAGSHIDINIDAINHRSDIWQDPVEYKPERFEEANIQDPYSYIPFSMGSRFRIKVDPSHIVERFPDLTMKAKTGIKVFLEERTKLSRFTQT
ncbi:hypothetical protein ACJMK2_008888 [Sinanodonta woodiana]|uniref:Uncharacterized protein n=1 Tax=Sinanodonta woodiana TaxID=1069815 RepID=A0ABD3VAK6_SINWO